MDTSFVIENKNLREVVLHQIFEGFGEEEICKRNGISRTDFLQIKNYLLKEMKDKSDAAEITSYAIRHLKNLIKERKLAKISKEYNIPEVTCNMIYQIINNKYRPTYGVIFLLRKYIAPCLWYYNETESFPKPITFESHFEEKYKDYNIKTKNELAQRKTLGQIYFDILKENMLMARFCTLHNCSYTEAANYVTMRHHKNGTFRYASRPTIQFIDKFKKELHPDYWYIYPDEVSDEEYRHLKKMAQDMVHFLSR